MFSVTQEHTYLQFRVRPMLHIAFGCEVNRNCRALLTLTLCSMTSRGQHRSTSLCIQGAFSQGVPWEWRRRKYRESNGLLGRKKSVPHTVTPAAHFSCVPWTQASQDHRRRRPQDCRWLRLGSLINFYFADFPRCHTSLSVVGIDLNMRGFHSDPALWMTHECIASIPWAADLHVN